VAKSISVDRVKQIIEEHGNYKKYTDNPESYKDFEYLLEALDAEPAQKCERCKDYDKVVNDGYELVKEGLKSSARIKELEQQLTDYLHTSSHKIKDKRIKELEDKVRSLQHGIDNKVMVVGEKELVDKIKELEGLLMDCLKYYLDPDHFLQRETVEKMFKIKQALEGK
jgi:hypothetical protein